MKGLGSSLCCSRLRLMAACRSMIERSTPRPDALAGHLGEEGFHGVQPRPGGRGEVEDPARVADKPGFHFGMLVGGVVVENGMHQLNSPESHRRIPEQT